MEEARSSFSRFLQARIGYLVPLALLGVLAGCAPPIGVTRVSPGESYRQSIINPLSQGELSNSAKAVLHRYNVGERFHRDPQDVIRFLHDIAIHDDRLDILFALSELSYLEGERLQGSASPEAPDAFLQSAVYAYLYLLGDGTQSAPTAYDRRFRDACDLYNRALGRAFPKKEGGELELRSGPRKLTVGDLNITPKPETLAWELDRIEGFLPADDYIVRGFTVRNRTPGLGLPLIALTPKSPETPKGGVFPVTAFLRIPTKVQDLGKSPESATLELYSAYDDAEVSVNGRPIPLETDTTAPLAYRLDNREIWGLGRRYFFKSGEITNPLILIQPYQPGKIPVVFVHGTASSPVWWAEMLNTLRADPVIRGRYQFWFFQYNSSNFILLSAAQLRETLSETVRKFDPKGKDPALRRMVVIGHSQGGLLTKMTAVEPGDNLWKSISEKSIDQLAVSPEIKAFLSRMVFFEPLPFVTRVVFISTPHRGSYLSKDWIRGLVRKIVSIPAGILSRDIYSKVVAQLTLPASVRHTVPTSIDGMSSENPLLKTLVEIPLRPETTGHSIVAVLPGMEIASGNDGVVEYQSAHIDGVASEFIVRTGHSSQGHPITIEEVRRILMEHIGIQAEGPATADPAQNTLP